MNGVTPYSPTSGAGTQPFSNTSLAAGALNQLSARHSPSHTNTFGKATTSFNQRSSFGQAKHPPYETIITDLRSVLASPNIGLTEQALDDIFDSYQGFCHIKNQLKQVNDKIALLQGPRLRQTAVTNVSYHAKLSKTYDAELNALYAQKTALKQTKDLYNAVNYERSWSTLFIAYKTDIRRLFRLINEVVLGRSSINAFKHAILRGDINFDKVAQQIARLNEGLEDKAHDKKTRDNINQDSLLNNVGPDKRQLEASATLPTGEPTGDTTPLPSSNDAGTTSFSWHLPPIDGQKVYVEDAHQLQDKTIVFDGSYKNGTSYDWFFSHYFENGTHMLTRRVTQGPLGKMNIGFDNNFFSSETDTNADIYISNTFLNGTSGWNGWSVKLTRKTDYFFQTSAQLTPLRNHTVYASAGIAKSSGVDSRLFLATINNANLTDCLTYYFNGLWGTSVKDSLITNQGDIYITGSGYNGTFPQSYITSPISKKAKVLTMSEPCLNSNQELLAVELKSGDLVAAAVAFSNNNGPETCSGGESIIFLELTPDLNIKKSLSWPPSISSDPRFLVNSEDGSAYLLISEENDYLLLKYSENAFIWSKKLVFSGGIRAYDSDIISVTSAPFGGIMLSIQPPENFYYGYGHYYTGGVTGNSTIIWIDDQGQVKNCNDLDLVDAPNKFNETAAELNNLEWVQDNEQYINYENVKLNLQKGTVPVEAACPEPSETTSANAAAITTPTATTRASVVSTTPPTTAISTELTTSTSQIPDTFSWVLPFNNSIFTGFGFSGGIETTQHKYALKGYFTNRSVTRFYGIFDSNGHGQAFSANSALVPALNLLPASDGDIFSIHSTIYKLGSNGITNAWGLTYPEGWQISSSFPLYAHNAIKTPNHNLLLTGQLVNEQDATAIFHHAYTMELTEQGEQVSQDMFYSDFDYFDLYGAYKAANTNMTVLGGYTLQGDDGTFTKNRNFIFNHQPNGGPVNWGWVSENDECGGFKDLIRLNSGTYLTGIHCSSLGTLFVEFSNSGNILNMTQLDHSITHMRPMLNEGFFIQDGIRASPGSPAFSIYRYNASGKFEWGKQYEWSTEYDYVAIEELTPTSDDGFLLSIPAWEDSATRNYGTQAIKLNKNGENFDCPNLKWRNITPSGVPITLPLSKFSLEKVNVSIGIKNESGQATRIPLQLANGCLSKAPAPYMTTPPPQAPTTTQLATTKASGVSTTPPTTDVSTELATTTKQVENNDEDTFYYAFNGPWGNLTKVDFRTGLQIGNQLYASLGYTTSEDHFYTVYHANGSSQSYNVDTDIGTDQAIAIGNNEFLSFGGKNIFKFGPYGGEPSFMLQANDGSSIGTSNEFITAGNHVFFSGELIKQLENGNSQYLKYYTNMSTSGIFDWVNVFSFNNAAQVTTAYSRIFNHDTIISSGSYLKGYSWADFMFAFKPNGTVLWGWSQDQSDCSSIYNMFSLSNNHTMVLSGCGKALVEFDINGKRINGVQFEKQLSHGEQMSDGGFFLRDYESGADPSLTLWRFNSTGQFSWGKQYTLPLEGGNYLEFSNVKPSNDGGFLVQFSIENRFTLKLDDGVYYEAFYFDVGLRTLKLNSNGTYPNCSLINWTAVSPTFTPTSSYFQNLQEFLPEKVDKNITITPANVSTTPLSLNISQACQKPDKNDISTPPPQAPTTQLATTRASVVSTTPPTTDISTELATTAEPVENNDEDTFYYAFNGPWGNLTGVELLTSVQIGNHLYASLGFTFDGDYFYTVYHANGSSQSYNLDTNIGSDQAIAIGNDEFFGFGSNNIIKLGPYGGERFMLQANDGSSIGASNPLKTGANHIFFSGSTIKRLDNGDYQYLEYYANMSTSGIFDWVNVFSFNNAAQVTSAYSRVCDHNTIISGGSYLKGYWTDFMFAFNPNGTVQWGWSQDQSDCSSIFNMFSLSNNHAMALSGCGKALVEFDVNGKRIDGNQFEKLFYYGEQMPGGGFFLRDHESGADPLLTLWRFNSTGQFSWGKQYTLPLEGRDYLEFRNVKPSDDGGFLVQFSVENRFGPKTAYGYYYEIFYFDVGLRTLKLNSNGTYPNCSLINWTAVSPTFTPTSSYFQNLQEFLPEKVDKNITITPANVSTTPLSLNISQACQEPNKNDISTPPPQSPATQHQTTPPTNSATTHMPLTNPSNSTQSTKTSATPTTPTEPTKKAVSDVTSTKAQDTTANAANNFSTTNSTIQQAQALSLIAIIAMSASGAGLFVIVAVVVIALAVKRNRSKFRQLHGQSSQGSADFGTDGIAMTEQQRNHLQQQQRRHRVSGHHSNPTINAWQIAPLVAPLRDLWVQNLTLQNPANLGPFVYGIYSQATGSNKTNTWYAKQVENPQPKTTPSPFEQPTLNPELVTRKLTLDALSVVRNALVTAMTTELKRQRAMSNASTKSTVTYADEPDSATQSLLHTERHRGDTEQSSFSIIDRDDIAPTNMFEVPETRLVKIKSSNEHSDSVSSANAVDVHLVSKQVEDYQSLSMLEVAADIESHLHPEDLLGTKNLTDTLLLADFIETTHYIPELASIDGQPLLIGGLPELLAVSKLFGNFKVFNNDTGYRVHDHHDTHTQSVTLIKNSAYMHLPPLPDPEVDEKSSDTTGMLQEEKLMTDHRDILFEGKEGLSELPWKNFSSTQKSRFLVALQCALNLFENKNVLNAWLKRKALALQTPVEHIEQALNARIAFLKHTYATELALQAGDVAIVSTDHFEN